MGITFGDRLIDSGYYDITPEQEREIEEREMELVWVHNVRAMIKTSRMFSDEMRERCLARFNEVLAERDILNGDFTELKRHAMNEGRTFGRDEFDAPYVINTRAEKAERERDVAQCHNDGQRMAIGILTKRAQRAEEAHRRIAAKAREYAAHYPQASDGRNTFTIFAEWVEALDEAETRPNSNWPYVSGCDEMVEAAAAVIDADLRQALRDFDVSEDAIKGDAELGNAAKATAYAALEAALSSGAMSEESIQTSDSGSEAEGRS